ncbi:MAG TPA: hypothetical protein DCK99_14960 [Blastocatellia bacterium]|nr:hypothetical protein [Blastocatellia bacterium]
MRWRTSGKIDIVNDKQWKKFPPVALLCFRFRGQNRCSRRNCGVVSKKKTPSLKSASGAGFSFEDKVAANLMSEMLAGQRSLGNDYGIPERIERQANDWEPFGDIVVTACDHSGEVCKIGGSVKSNRQINANGSNGKFCAGIWAVTGKNVFISGRTALALYSAPLSADVTDQLDALCRQARQLEPERLDEKVVHEKARRIYDSFRNAVVAGVAGLPGLVLKHFIFRQFDFEATTSKSEAEAVRLCREILAPESRNDREAKRLWQELLDIAQDLRVSGGAVTRETLAAKLRNKFQLLDDPSDVAAWSRIRKFSRDGLDEVTITLPGGISVPRKPEHTSLATLLAKSRACSVLGDSGFGKSALVKKFAAEREAVGDEVVWLKAERISILDAAVPNFEDVARRTRRASGLLVVDAIEGCYDTAALGRLSRLMKALVTAKDSVWSLVVVCQTPEWARASAILTKELGKHAVLTERLDCGPLSDEDFNLVRSGSPSVNLLAQKPPLRLLLRSPKMLDVLLTGQLAENRDLAGEADLVDWWWENQVRGGKQVAAEERVARQLANKMADELCSELSPDAVSGAEDAASKLIQNRVLRRTPDGLLRFDHDLLADWSRVMHLKSLGDQTLSFIRAHTENPPWLRAIRLLSQHLLDRAADFERWRHVLDECSIPAPHDKEPSAQNLQIVDAWLEGVIFSIDPSKTLERVRDLLFANNGWRLQRLIRRLIHVATIPDPVAQDRARQIDSESAEVAAALYRLPIWGLWSPIIGFLVLHKAEAIEMVPVEISEIAAMWARMEEYFHIKWPAFADVVLLNAESELRREVAGEYRHSSGPYGRGNKSRTAIYTGALHAASQYPERAAKLLLKAAGRCDWEAGDMREGADAEWAGYWRERRMSIGVDTVEMPVASWPHGPRRRTSDDFFHAWFEGGAVLTIYKGAPAAACEATLAFLFAWPKRRLFPSHYSHGGENHGFNFEADHMYPPFYHKGPFLVFLRQDWRPALEMIIHLLDFATDRYAEWWPYEDKPSELKFQTPIGQTVWFGNHQVYVWHRFNWNTPHVVTVALMALEKWLDEQIEAGGSVHEPIQMLYQKARPLAFAGLLVSLGKRHPELFINDLRPLLFLRELYMYDFSAVREHFGAGHWPHDGQYINNLRRQWDELPGRKTSLLDASCSWFIGRPDLQPVLKEVGAAWTQRAKSLSGENRLALLRWAANFEASNWQKITQNGEEMWQRVLPEDLRDVEAERAHVQHQTRLALPYQCSDLLEKRPHIEASMFDGIWRQLHKWPSLESATSGAEQDELRSSLLDDRHSRAGLLAVLLSLGGDWLDEDESRRPWVEKEVRKLVANPPKITAYSADDIHEDGEGFLARCAVCCWAKHPNDSDWRSLVGSFVGVYRYRSIAQLFDEAFRARKVLGKKYQELEAFALAFAVVRRKAKVDGFKPQPEMIEKWMREWLPKFAKGRGPKWTDRWSQIEFVEAFPPSHDPHYGLTGRRTQRSRRWYGFDMGVILGAFGGSPPLTEAQSSKERQHWLTICKELVAVLIRTLPPADVEDATDEWRYEPWSPDRKICDLIAARLFECAPDEQRELWLPFFELPPAAHYHMTELLSSLLTETLRTDPPRIAQLLPIWRAIAEHLFVSERWTGALRFKQREVWKYIFFYGTPFDSVRHKDHGPLVDGLRDLFERHLRAIEPDDHDQSAVAAFLISDAGQCLLPDALEWLNSSWQQASSYFWNDVAESSAFERLLKFTWRNHFPAIRANPELLKAFKVLTLNLASQQVATAIDIQRQIGSG